MSLTAVGVVGTDEHPESSKVKVTEGVVMPRRPVAEAIAEAMLLLKKTDGAYVPGKMDSNLAGYFTSAHVKEDGTRSDRKLAFPARQHAYFIFTFLRYYAYTGEREWLLRAGDLAEWNLAHSTPATYHEDVMLKPADYPSAEPMSFTADYLFRQGKMHPEYVEMGRQILRRMEERLVHTEGHPAAPAPAVAEQAGFNHIMPGHTARYCLALADLYSLSRDPQVKRQALSGINAVTYMQAPSGLFRTFFYSVNRKAKTEGKPDWYSQHLYTVCHVLEAMPSLPELVPNGQDHLLGSSVYVREIHYLPGQVSFETIAPSRSVLKLSFVPGAVYVGMRKLDELKESPSDKHTG